MLAKSLEKMGVSYRLLRLGVGDFISFLFDVGYGFVVICFTKRTLAYEQALYWGRGEGGGRGVGSREVTREQHARAFARHTWRVC